MVVTSSSLTPPVGGGETLESLVTMGRALALTPIVLVSIPPGSSPYTHGLFGLVFILFPYLL